MLFVIIIFRRSTFDCTVAAKNLRENEQLKIIPYSPMQNLLYAKRVITHDEKENLNNMTNDDEKMSKLTDILIKSLNQKITKKYKGFLESMEESEDILLEKMAESLGK